MTQATTAGGLELKACLNVQVCNMVKLSLLSSTTQPEKQTWVRACVCVCALHLLGKSSPAKLLRQLRLEGSKSKVSVLFALTSPDGGLGMSLADECPLTP